MFTLYHDVYLRIIRSQNVFTTDHEVKEMSLKNHEIKELRGFKNR